VKHKPAQGWCTSSILDAHRDDGQRFCVSGTRKGRLVCKSGDCGNSSCRSSPFFSFTLQHFAADNSKADAASTAADKELATFGNGIFCVVVALLRVLPNGRPHRLLLVHVVNVYLCKTRVPPQPLDATRIRAQLARSPDCVSACRRCFSPALWQPVRAASAVEANKRALTLRWFCDPAATASSLIAAL